MLTNVVGASVALVIIPVIIPELGQDGHVGLPQGDAVLAVEVVRLAISPVKPGDRLIHVRPHPVTRGALAVSLLCTQLLNTFTSI